MNMLGILSFVAFCFAIAPIILMDVLFLQFWFARSHQPITQSERNFRDWAHIVLLSLLGIGGALSFAGYSTDIVWLIILGVMLVPPLILAFFFVRSFFWNKPPPRLSLPAKP